MIFIQIFSDLVTSIKLANAAPMFPPISIDLIGDLMQNGYITDFDNNFAYQVCFKHIFFIPDCKQHCKLLLIYNKTKWSNSFLLP